MPERWHRLDFCLPHHQMEGLRMVSATADLPVAEVLRRMIGHCSREATLNELVPERSGFLSVGGGR